MLGLLSDVLQQMQQTAMQSLIDSALDLRQVN